MGKLGVPAAAFVFLLAASGCSVPPVSQACPAIGHSTVIPVQISGSLAGSVAAVQICSDEEDCSRGVPVGAPLEASVPPVPSANATQTPAGADPAGPFSHFMTSRIDQANWQIETDMVTPTAVTAQALDLRGRILVRTEAALEWTRISGSEQCGGNARSTPILLNTDQ